MKTNLLILASGAGTRNFMFTYNNALPKCLMSVGDKTCIEAIINSYDGLVDDIYVAVQNAHKDCVSDVLKFRTSKAINIVSYEPTHAAMQSIIAAFNCIPGYEQANWYINWSDVFADAMKACITDSIIVDTVYRHRNIAFKAANGAIEVHSTYDSNGNVPGIFFVQGTTLANCINQCIILTDAIDFDMLLTIVCKPNIVSISDLHDIGDYNKYVAYMQSIKTDNICRYFNELEFDKKVVHKRPKTDYGIKLHNIELAYYRAYGNLNTPLAKLLGYDSSTKTMTIERIKGSTCQAVVNAKPTTNSKLSAVNKMLTLFNDAIQSFDKVPLNIVDSPDDIRNAMKAEFVDMINTRLQPCEHILQTVIQTNNIKSIENMPISSHSALMLEIEKWFNDCYNYGIFDTCLVHGDPNTDNTLISNDKIRFVDPRGYFGNLKTLGLGVKQYDVAKFVYGFSGYSKFNTAEFIAVNIVNGDVQVFIGPEEQPNITDISLFDIDVDFNIKVLVGIIWLKLTSYIINDPMKSVAAYLYGNALLTKLFNIK